MDDFASCTTDSGSDVKVMTVNFAKQHGILWDWCFTHQVSRAYEHACGTAACPAASKNSSAHDVVQMVIKAMEIIHKSLLRKDRFKDHQVSHASMVNPRQYMQRVNGVAYSL